MKRIITSLLLFLVVMCSYAQTKRYYCEVKGIEKELSSGLKIIFDFGNQASYNMWGDLSSKLKFVDEKNGEEIKFNSMVDAANYMVEKRLELSTSIFISIWWPPCYSLDFL